MKRLSLILSIFLISTPTLFSQGYMGNHFMINAEVVFSPSYLNPNFNGNSGYLAFNYIFSPNIEIISWKRGSVGVVGHFLHSQYQTTKDNGIEDIWDYYETQYVADEKVPFNAFGYGVFYKQYFSRSRAPIGTYFKTEFDFFHHQYFSDSEGERSFIFGFKFEIGKDYLFYDRLKLSMGLSMGLTTKGWDFSDPKLHLSASQNRMLGLYWLGFKIGIGVLAF